jgi:protein TonB
MASPAELGQILPDTLPEDFGEWDSEASTATLPVDSAKPESRDNAPRVAAPRSATPSEYAPPREAAPRPAAHKDIATRNVEAERSTAPVPRSPVAPVIPADPRANTAPVPRSPRGATSGPSSATRPDDEAFFRRLRSLNTVVDKLPSTAPPTEGSVNQETAKEEAAALLERQQKMEAATLERQQLREASESISLSFASDLADQDDEVDEQERAARRKWIMIIAVAAASILLVVFRLLHAGAVPSLKKIAVSQPTSSSSDAFTPPDTSTLDAAPSKLPGTAKPTAATAAARTTDTPQDPDQNQAAPVAVQSKMMHDQLLAPTRIPQEARNGSASEAPPAAGLGASMEALNGNGAPSAVFNGTGQSKLRVVPKVVTVSAGVAVGLLTRKTQPIYPTIAKSARVQGTVVLQATISKSGSVDNLHVVTGPVMLRQAAVDAVKTWHYRPYMLNNAPTDVETTINVIFALGG